MNQPIAYEDFRSLVCTSAQQYYDYLTIRFDKGILSSGARIISVYQFTPGRISGEYSLTTGEKVTHPDSCQVWIMGRYIPSIEILTVDTVRKNTYTVRIADSKHILERLPNLQPSDIQIVSDLRFLIGRLMKFYQAASFNFLPPSPAELPQLPNAFTDDLSDEQLQAINTVFTSPVSYISGAPGTGKTRAVLSRCILRYILSKKRIILLAPTNNAVEQMLRGILPILRDAGINLECVYRLGAASEEFAKEYPEVIGDSALDGLLSNLMKQKAFYESQIDNAYSLHPKAKSLESRLQESVSVHNQISELIHKIKDCDSQLTVFEKEDSEFPDVISNLQENYDNAKKRTYITRETMEACEKSINQISKQIHRMKPFFWMKTERAKIESDYYALLIALPNYKAIHADAMSELDRCGRDLTQSRRKQKASAELKIQCENTRNDLIQQIHKLADWDQSYKKAVHNILSADDFSLDGSTAFIASLTKQHEESLAEAAKFPFETYREELTSIHQQIENLGTHAKAYQKEHAFVLAGTIDSALYDLYPYDDSLGIKKRPITVSHVFLDEAGYTCLAKGMAAFAPGAPVTFPGDHKQLPPVCEMNRIPVECAPVCLWALPVAYYSELVFGDFPSLYHNCYGQSAEPTFENVSYGALNVSYRFGPTLAKILGKFIYTDKFTGISDAPFEIQIVNAPYMQGPDKNSNQSEADAIHAYLREHPIKDLAILTPYKNQVKLLRRVLPKEYKDNILTVHRSQGCEWETVILSVTDAHRPYFTDSKLSIGKSVLNTAISRTKRQLIVVCDTASWITRRDQLLTELIHCGYQTSTDTAEFSLPSR